MLFVWRSCTGPNISPRFQGLGRFQSATQSATHGHPLAKVLQLVSYGRYGRSRPLTDEGGFSMTAPARQGCTDEAQSQAFMPKAMNPAA